MGMVEVLGRYADPRRSMMPASGVEQDFGSIVQEAGPDAMQDGIAEAFRAEETPGFEEMVASLFEHSEPRVRAGLLDSLLAGLAPTAQFQGGGGALADVWRKYHAGARVAVDRAAQVDPTDVEQVAREARRENPSVLERISRFYARHPGVVRNLGPVAMNIVLARIARRAHH